MIPALLLLTVANPKELGLVEWRRDFEAATLEAQSSHRPLLVLFDEVPGCSTCTHYGEVVLSHPLLVEAAETLFVPVAIYNNEGGADKKVLEAFGEPAWNNPVVRIVDADRRDLAPRLNGDYQPWGLANTMVTALRAAKKPVPLWLEQLELELHGDQRRTERTTWAMGCFWSGEMRRAFSGASLTPAQACRVSAAIARGEDPSRYLSPRQIARR